MTLLEVSATDQEFGMTPYEIKMAVQGAIFAVGIVIAIVAALVFAVHEKWPMIRA